MSIRPVFSSLLVAAFTFGCAPTDSSSSGGPVDLPVEALHTNGCLDLAGTVAALRAMGESTIVREATTSVFLDGESLRRNFVGEISFSHLRFSERPAPVASSDLPAITQTGCESVTMNNGPAGDQTFKVVPSEEDPTLFAIEREDGFRQEWRLTSPRSLEVTTSSSIMDRCPLYIKAKARTRIEYHWGTREELAGIPVTISRAMLRSISTVTREMPLALLAIATYDPEDRVTVTSTDVGQLTKAKIEFERCPYRAEPPSSAEPPPPQAGAQLPGATP